MTREEAIYVLKNTAWLGSGELVGDVSEAIQMAVNALKRSETPNNSDVISRQALCDYALNQKDKSVTPNDIMRFPSAQPEIIHCRDCKHYYYADNRIPQEQRCVCALDDERWKPDDFCSYAERRENERREREGMLQLSAQHQTR